MRSTAHEHRAAPSTSVLLAVRSSRTLDYAKAFAERGCAPIVAFTSGQLEAFGSVADIVVADGYTDPDATILSSMSGVPVAACVYLGGHLGIAAPHVDCLDADVPPERVVAHALAILAARANAPVRAVLGWGALELDLLRRRAFWKGRETNLTATQFDILVTLVRAGGAVVTKEELQRAVWPDAEPDNGERLLAHMRRIRVRLEADPARPTFLLTSRGVGFRLADPVDEASPQLTLISSDDSLREHDASA